MLNEKELELLQKEVYEANLYLHNSKLAIHTWGNVSAISKDRKYMVIKPSGVSYELIKSTDMVIVDLETGKSQGLNPSSDAPTHLLMYKANDEIRAIVHTHSTHAVAWSQAEQAIPCFGTTHADNFLGAVPITRVLSGAEIVENYEFYTGKAIVEAFQDQGSMPKNGAILARRHGPFTWSSKSPKDAVDLAITLEEVARMAMFTKMINPSISSLSKDLESKHYYRKHGANAYYGQAKKIK
ncbi:L-ribulose-5-phosphate 4-epimerase [Mycoplasma testudineum]|uniref:L-ribulose-5-phosphate 4-epimerase n=1 Tax=Mycoplasma testudineum TaxID=244584 RepID=A0A4R6IJI1_9MOLU|nr:L-ribulose-5-phosphate 4-epimerase [Mycoplasma testudineum]